MFLRIVFVKGKSQIVNRVIQQLIALITCVLILTPAQAAQAAQVTGLRVFAAPEKTRVVFDLDAKLDYTLFTMTNPHRVVIDMKGTHVKKGAFSKISKNHLLTGVRSAARDGGVRVVLDLRDVIKPESFTLQPEQNKGHRLVIDLKRPGVQQVDPTLMAVKKTITPQPVAKQAGLLAAKAPSDKSKIASATSTKKPEKTPTKPVVMRDLIVAIDAGHGGQDPGAIGKKGTREKDVVLSISKRLAKKINATPGMRAVLTRDRDIFLPLRKRMEIAREHHADLFISIHADAFHNHKVQGSSVYVLSEKGASSEAAKWLAAKENASDFIGGVTLENKDRQLQEVLLDLSQNAVLDASMNVADKVLQGLKNVGKVHKRDVQQAGFVVLKSPDIPSLLIETAFISNPSEERKLLKGSEQDKLASAILKGVKLYFKDYAPPGTRLAVR